MNSSDEIVDADDIAILKTSCVSFNRFDSSERKRVVDREVRLVACPVVKDCIIVSRMNTPDRVGACGISTDDLPNLFLPDRLWRLRLEDGFDPYLVYVALATDVRQARIRGIASGTSGSMHNVPQGAFLDIELELPLSLKEQQLIGAFFQKLDSLIALHQRERFRALLDET